MNAKQKVVNTFRKSERITYGTKKDWAFTFANLKRIMILDNGKGIFTLATWNKKECKPESLFEKYGETLPKFFQGYFTKGRAAKIARRIGELNKCSVAPLILEWAKAQDLEDVETINKNKEYNATLTDNVVAELCTERADKASETCQKWTGNANLFKPASK